MPETRAIREARARQEGADARLLHARQELEAAHAGAQPAEVLQAEATVASLVEEATLEEAGVAQAVNSAADEAAQAPDLPGVPERSNMHALHETLAAMHTSVNAVLAQQAVFQQHLGSMQSDMAV